MKKLIHVLGSDIPHHNQTILHFFNDILIKMRPCSIPFLFMVVSKKKSFLTAFHRLQVEIYSSRIALVKAILKRSKDHRTNFFLHGQFNPWIWAILLIGILYQTQVYWHVWGADLYERSRNLQSYLFYQLRRLAYGKISHLFATRGDISYYQRYHRYVPTSLLYFPTRMCSKMPKRSRQDDILTCLLGNSGDPSNRHITALQSIYQHFGKQIRILIPMGYPESNQNYIRKVQAAANLLFSEGQVHLLTNKIAFDDYLQIVRNCDLGYFSSERQQGIGTICLLIQANIPVVISRKNLFWKDMVQHHLPILFDDDILNRKIITQAQQKLTIMDKKKIAFFYPNFVTNWRKALKFAEGDL